MSTFWANGVSGDWATADNWSPSQVPTSGDLVFINATGNYVVTISTAAVAGYLDVADSGAELLENAGSLTIPFNLGIEAGLVVLNRPNSIGAVVIDRGVLELGNAGALGSATVDFQGDFGGGGGGELLGTVTETIANPISIGTTGITTTIAAADGTSLTLTGAMSFSDSDDIRIGTSAQDGTVIWSAASATNATHADFHLQGGTLRAGASSLSDALSVAAGGTLIDGGTTFDIAGLPMSILSLVGAGTITNSGGAAALTLINGGNFAGTFSGPMTLTLGGNSLAILSGASTLSGAITLQSGSGLTLANTGTNVFNGALTGSGALTVQGPGETILNANGSYTGPTTITAGILALGNGGGLGSSAVTMNGGELLATTSETIGNAISLPHAVSAAIGAAHGATLVLTGQLTLGGDNGNTLNIGTQGEDGTIVAQLAGYSTNNGVPVIHVSAGTLKAGSTVLPALLRAANGTTVDAGAALDLGGFSASVAGLHGGGTVTNSGALATLSLSTTLFQGGGANFSGAVTGALSLDVTGDSLLSGNVNISGSTTIESAVTLVDAGAFRLGGPISGTGTIRINTGKVLEADASVSSGPTVAFNGSGDLVLSDAPQFAAALSGFDSTDKLDFTQFGAITSLSFAGNGTGTGGTLTVADGSLLAHIALTGSYLSSGFSSASDGTGGSLITYTGQGSASTARDDFNGDGASEILLNNTSSGAYVDWTMSGAQITSGQSLTFNGAPVALDSSWSVAGTGDFDGAGKTDILLRNTNGSFVDWTMNGPAIVGAANPTFNGVAVGLDSSWSVAGIGDFNGDSKADILLHNANGSFVDWTMNGSAISAAANLTFGGAAVSLDPSWSVTGIGDFDGDGRADILLHNTNGSFADWAMNGSTITSAQNLTFGGAAVGLDSAWTVLGTADFNGDGHADILLRGSDGSFVDWQMNGSTIASAGDLVFQGTPVKLDSSWTFADIGDYNGDGRADILLRNSSGSFVDWTMNGSSIVAAQTLTFSGAAVTLDSSWRTS